MSASLACSGPSTSPPSRGPRLLSFALPWIACATLAQDALAQSPQLVGWGEQVFDERWRSEGFAALDAGYQHVLALRPDGSVVAWGSNTSKQCRVPALPPSTVYLQVSAGNSLSAAVRSDGQIVCWGSNAFGNGNVPGLPAGTSYDRVSSGGYHTAALRSDGQLVCWGNNGSGQCAVPALPAGTTYVDVSAGESHTLALRSDGAILAWGSDSDGQSSAPAATPGKTPAKVEAGKYHSAVLYSDGTLECWGRNNDGQCDVPALQAGQVFAQISLGARNTLAVLNDGTVLNWGLQAYGLGDIPNLPAGVGFSQVSAGANAFSVALRSDQRPETWGQDYLSQTNVPPLPSGVEPVEVVVADDYTLVLGSDGEIASWGGVTELQPPALPPGARYVRVAAGGVTVGFAALRDDGQLVTWNGPAAPVLPPGVVYVDVQGGRQFLLALRSDGQIVTWGASPTLPWMIVPALPAGLGYTALRGGFQHGVALRSDGSVVCWGVNGAGQLDVPALPSGVIYVEIEAGDDFSAARRSDGVLVQWGLAMPPVPSLGSGLAFVDAVLGSKHGLARISDGSVVGWGTNALGQAAVPSQPGGMLLTGLASRGNRNAAIRRAGPPCGGATTYCGPPAVNSTGAGAHLEASGCAGLTGNDLTLAVDGLPPGNLGLLIYASEVGAVPFGAGTLCLGGQVLRVLPPIAIGPSGAVSVALDLGQPPFGSGPGQVQPGSLWNFQLWYRDPAAGGAGFNLSDAAHVVFAP